MRKVISKSNKKVLFLICGFIVLIFSCSNVSIFQGFDVPNTEKISSLSGEKLLDVLEKNIDSKVFYETLTKSQKSKILSNLDNIIKANDSSTSIQNINNVTRAAIYAIDILIYSDSLTYAVIYDLADPIIIAITGKDVSINGIFSSYTEPLQKTVEIDKTTAKEVISQCFYNLYKITSYYDIASISALAGSYSGGDLQKFLVAGILSGIVSGTSEAINSTAENITDISNIVAENFINWKDSGQSASTLLSYLFSEIQNQLGETGTSIVEAYKNQLLEKAKILGDIASNAGYLNLAKGAIYVLERWAQ